MLQENTGSGTSIPASRAAQNMTGNKLQLVENPNRLLTALHVLVLGRHQRLATAGVLKWTEISVYPSLPVSPLPNPRTFRPTSAQMWPAATSDTSS